MALDEREPGVAPGVLDPGWTAERALVALVDALDEAVLLYDTDLVCRAAGARVAALFGADPAALPGLARGEIIRRLAGSAADPAAFEAAARDAATSPQRVDVVRPAPRTLLWTARPVADGGAGAMDLIRDVTREDAAERRADDAAHALAEASTTDALTGLLNRRRFLQELDREHRRAQRAWDSYAIARIDVDRMKALNQAHGRAAGDALLRRLGDELRASRREYDLVARWDGDELVVCLPGVDAKAATVVVQRALMNMRERAREVIEGALEAGAGAGEGARGSQGGGEAGRPELMTFLSRLPASPPPCSNPSPPKAEAGARAEAGAGRAAARRRALGASRAAAGRGWRRGPGSRGRSRSRRRSSAGPRRARRSRRGTRGRSRRRGRWKR